MSSRIWKRAALLSAVAGPIALLIGVSGAAPRQDAKKVIMAPAKYKNIKILKMIPADQLIPIMHNWNDALGVKCDFCHTIVNTPDGKHGGFEKDDKKMKTVARQMLVMAMGANKNVKAVEGKITCFMCHRGHAEPEGEPKKP
ncbi:MAG: c-type cytochrome [Chthonomonadales bacterium]